MLLIIPRDIPAFNLLQDLCFIMDNNLANTQDIRPLEVLIVNLMPTKIQTEISSYRSLKIPLYR